MNSHLSLLLLSNSTNPEAPYLSFGAPHINEFVGDLKLNALFIPYAGVSITYDEYFHLVQNALLNCSLNLSSAHQYKEPELHKVMLTTDVIITGGGNTFHLLKELYQKNLIPVIRERIFQGTKYIGWSAGSNITCPTICTTNDMPIVEPPSFAALNILPFQINPHYINQNPEHFTGETRDMRLLEFAKANPKGKVIGLPEGCGFKIQNGVINYIGTLESAFISG